MGTNFTQNDSSNDATVSQNNSPDIMSVFDEDHKIFTGLSTIFFIVYFCACSCVCLRVLTVWWRAPGSPSLSSAVWSLWWSWWRLSHSEEWVWAQSDWCSGTVSLLVHAWKKIRTISFWCFVFWWVSLIMFNQRLTLTGVKLNDLHHKVLPSILKHLCVPGKTSSLGFGWIRFVLIAMQLELHRYNRQNKSMLWV